MKNFSFGDIASLAPRLLGTWQYKILCLFTTEWALFFLFWLNVHEKSKLLLLVLFPFDMQIYALFGSPALDFCDVTNMPGIIGFVA